MVSIASWSGIGGNRLPLLPTGGCRHRLWVANPSPERARLLSLSPRPLCTRVLPRSLDGKTPLAQNPCVRTNCAVVATWIEWTATPATGRGQGQGAPETSKEQHAELLGLETSRSRRRDATERDTCQKSAPGTKECLLTRVQTRPHHCCAELCFNVKCRTSLPSPAGNPRHRVVKSNLPTLETPGDVHSGQSNPLVMSSSLQWAAVVPCGPPSPHCRATHNQSAMEGCRSWTMYQPNWPNMH